MKLHRMEVRAVNNGYVVFAEDARDEFKTRNGKEFVVNNRAELIELLNEIITEADND